MTISVHLDTLEAAETEEVGGVIMSATRSFLIDSDSDSDWPADHTGALTVLNFLSDMPAPGDTFSSWLPWLYLVSRSVRSRNKRQHEGLLEYRFINPSLNHYIKEGDKLVAPYLLKPSTGIKQVTADNTSAGALIEVTHNNLTQIAEVSALDLDFGYRFETVVSTNAPSGIAFDWLNKVNGSQWKIWPGSLVSQWLCTDATFKPLDCRSRVPHPPDSNHPGDPVSPPAKQKWIFDFEFRFNRRGWLYDAVWRDTTSGRSPLMRGSAEGRTRVNWHVKRDFNLDPADPPT